MTNEATGQAETLRREVAAPNNARAGAEFITSFPTREVLPAFFSVIASDSPTPEKINAIKNVKAALDDPEGSGLRERATGDPRSFLDGAILGTKEVWMNPSPEALLDLAKMRANYERGLRGSPTQTQTGANHEIMVMGVDGKAAVQALMAGVFNKDESPQFRQALLKTFLNWATKPPLRKHYFGPGTNFGEVDFSRERDRQAEEGQTERLGRRAGRAFRQTREAPGEAMNRVRAQLLREQQWEQGILNRTREAILTPPRRARTLIGRGAEFVRSAPGRLWNRTGEVTGPRARGILNGATGGAGRILHGAGEVPGRVGNFAFGIFRRQPDQAQPTIPEPPAPAQAEPQGIDTHDAADEPAQPINDGVRPITEAEERSITTLSQRLDQARAQAPHGEFHIPDEIPAQWNRVLDVIPVAIPQRIEAHYHQELEKYDPDRILPVFEERGMLRESEEYRALEELLRSRTNAIRAAYEEARNLGLVSG